MLDRSAKSFFAVFLLVAALLIFTNLIITQQPLENSAWVIALVVLAISAFFWIWMWLEGRERPAAANRERDGGTGMLQLPQAQAREWVVPRQSGILTAESAAAQAEAAVATAPNADPTQESPLPFEEIATLSDSPSGVAVAPGSAPSTGLEPAVVPHEVDAAPNLPGELAVPQTSPAVEATSAVMQAVEAETGDELLDRSAQPKLETSAAPADSAAVAAGAQTSAVNLTDATTGTADPTQHTEQQFVQVTPEAESTPLVEATEQITAEADAAPIVEAAQSGDAMAQDTLGDVMAAAPEARDTALDTAGAAEAAAGAAVVDTSAADDLTIVEGIGPKFNAALNEAGIYTFAQLAASTPEQLQTILRDAGYGRVPATYSTWGEQAGFLARGDRGGFDAFVESLVGGRRRTDE
jgi:predicted flap endonuclease-1-like 5' DNA nuclease